MGDLPTLALTTDLEVPPCLDGCIYSPVWPWSCHQEHLPRDPEGAILPLPWVTALLTLVSAMNSEMAYTQLQPFTVMVWDQSCLPRNPTRDTLVQASRGKLTDLGPNYGLESSPLTWSQLIQLWSRTRSAYPGTQ